MKKKSRKRKKPRKLARGSWLRDLGELLAGIAAIAEVTFKVVKYLSRS